MASKRTGAEANAEGACANWRKCPVRLLASWCQFLPAQDIACCSAVCTTWKIPSVYEDRLFHQRYLETWEEETSERKEIAPLGQLTPWKQRYVNRFKVHQHWLRGKFYERKFEHLSLCWPHSGCPIVGPSADNLICMEKENNSFALVQLPSGQQVSKCSLFPLCTSKRFVVFHQGPDTIHVYEWNDHQLLKVPGLSDRKVIGWRSPEISDKYLVIARLFEVLAIDLQTQKQIWSLKLELDTLSNPLILNDQTVFVLAFDHLFKIQLETGKLEQKISIKGHRLVMDPWRHQLIIINGHGLSVVDAKTCQVIQTMTEIKFLCKSLKLTRHFVVTADIFEDRINVFDRTSFKFLYSLNSRLWHVDPLFILSSNCQMLLPGAGGFAPVPPDSANALS